MKGKKLYLLAESVLCALAALVPAAAAVRMYLSGAAERSSGGLFYYIYTREKAGAALLAILPLFTAFIAFTAAGWILGIRDEEADKPAPLKGMDVKQSVTRAVPQKTGKRARIARDAVLVLSAALIIMGIYNGGLADVFAKGATICTECVGLG